MGAIWSDPIALPTMTAAILGASADRSKFGNKAVRAFVRAGHEVFPVNPNEGEVEGLPTQATIGDAALTAGGSLDVASIYLPPRVTLEIVPQIAAAAPREVWLNPGADDPAVVQALEAAGLRVRCLCSIIEVGFSPGQFPA